MNAESRTLPNGWTKAQIGDLCELINGRAFKPTDWSQNGLPIIRIQNLNDASAKFNCYDGEFADKHLVRNGDLLFAWSGTPGTSFGAHIWLGKDALLNQHIFRVLIIDNELDKRFFQVAINQKLEELIGKAHGGVGLRHVTKGKFESTEISLPPLAEQRRIVSKIESLQKRSGKAREMLAEVVPLLDQFRRSLLASAFRGDLTAPWRATHPNTEPASELLERICKERRQRWELAKLASYDLKGKQAPDDLSNMWKESQAIDESDLPELPPSWCWCRIDDVGSVQLGRQRSPKYHSGNNMRPYLRVMNVYEDRIDISDAMEMEFSAEDFDRYKLESGDILLNEGQSHELVGRSAIYRDEIPGACFTNTLVRFRPFVPICSEYPQIVFLGYLKTGQFQKIASLTVNIAHLGAAKFAELAFPLPPLEEQAEIVRQTRTALNQIKSLEQGVANQKTLLKELDQSILSKAFRGELVEQDPSDEPASELLARIREQRQSAQSSKNQKARHLQP